jgi:hypothetical protein
MSATVSSPTHALTSAQPGTTPAGGVSTGASRGRSMAMIREEEQEEEGEEEVVGGVGAGFEGGGWSFRVTVRTPLLVWKRSMG